MRMNEFENKLLKRIKKIDEGLALGLLKMFFTPALKRSLKTVKEKDPDLFADLESLEHYNRRQERRIKQYKKMLKSDDPDQVKLAKDMLKLFKK